MEHRRAVRRCTKRIGRAAERMEISINTVRDHVRSIYEKLHVHSKSAAVSKALRAGII